MSYQDPSTALRFSLETTDYTCKTAGMMTAYRPCGCKLLRVEISDALEQKVVGMGVEIRNGDLICVAGTMCGIKSGLRLQRLLGLLR